ncbi:hypothetical protein ACFXTH_007809 [Malus domestica]
MVAMRLMDINISNGFCTSVELDVPCANAGQDKPCLDRCTSKFPGSSNKDQSQCGYVLGQGIGIGVLSAKLLMLFFSVVCFFMDY